MGDKNLEWDKFFRGKIEESPDGYIELDCIMSCNKIKKMNITKDQIIDAIKDSKTVEVSFTQTKIRRMENKPLPGFTEKPVFNRDENQNKRQKTNKMSFDRDKQLEAMDFENRIIVHFKTEDIDPETDTNYKINARFVQNMVYEKFDKLKIIYYRSN